VSLEVAAGEFVAIVGASGSGKSTLLHVIGGLDRDFSGRATVAGRDLSVLGDRDLSRLRNEALGFVFQSFNLLDHLTCLENVLLPSFFAAGGGRDAPRRARLALERVGLSDKAEVRPPALSGGQKQRVAIARALVGRPVLLLADEPTGNLDAGTGGEIIALFSALNREEGLTLVIVTHEERVFRAAGRVLRLDEGRLSS
jgi:putative ABC transport system ATP-binding protein